ncbi:hypothetical protein GQ600_21173 [Phytophthora cactorum]|nr:hypothetical protein GQ600_21173 [Phytophthora cactorum]
MPTQKDGKQHASSAPSEWHKLKHDSSGFCTRMKDRYASSGNLPHLNGCTRTRQWMELLQMATFMWLNGCTETDLKAAPSQQRMVL